MNRGARAAQVRRKGGRKPPTAHGDGVEGADRKSAVQLPPAAKTSNFQYNPPQQNNMQQQNNWELNREVRAAQGRRKGGRRPPTARGDGVERADRMSARGTLQLPPAAEC